MDRQTTFFIIGGGPSVNTTPIHLLKDYRCIGVNNSYTIAPWIEYVYFGDAKWWDWHRKALFNTNIPIITCCQNGRVLKEANGMGIKLATFSRDLKGKGITEDRNKVCWNGNSGGSAINIAYHLGAKKIVLVGFDMRRVNGEKNFHNDHKEQQHNPFRRHLKGFPIIAKDAKRLGLEIINATPGSAIDSFPITTLENVLNGKQS